MAEFWQEVHQRGQQTLAVWNTFSSSFQVGTLTLAGHTADVESLPGLADAKAAQEDAVDDAALARDENYNAIRDIVVRVPQLIEATLDDDDLLQNDLDDVFGIIPNSQASAQERARRVISLWNRVNAKRVAMIPPLPPLLLGALGVGDLQTRLANHPGLLQTVEDERSALSQSRSLLAKTARRVDRNNKRWYAAWSKNFDQGSPELNALSQVSTDPGVADPTALEIDTLTVNGDMITIGYVAGGGEHATTIELLWKIVGVDSDFGHTTPVVVAGQVVGPFAAGTEIQFKTRATNSASSTDSEVRSFTM